MHLFFTGPKGVGKSTLVNAIAAACPGVLGGFRTIRTGQPGRYTVHLLPLSGPQEASEENLLFVCKQPSPELAARFERLGCGALAQSAGADLLLMDELGPHEGEAAAFQAAVWAAIEGAAPILGVLQEADAPFLKRIAEHPKVCLLRVTPENRDALARQVPHWAEILTNRTGGIL